MNVTERYVELLANEGYRPKVDEDDATEIEFKVERIRFRMIVDATDDEFLATRSPTGSRTGTRSNSS